MGTGFEAPVKDPSPGGSTQGASPSAGTFLLEGRSSIRLVNPVAPTCPKLMRGLTPTRFFKTSDKHLRPSSRASRPELDGHQ